MTDNWTYEPCGDVDGDPVYDGIAGIDHLVMDGDTQIACAPDARRAILITAAPRMLEALKKSVTMAEYYVGDLRYAGTLHHADDAEVFLAELRALVAEVTREERRR